MKSRIPNSTWTDGSAVAFLDVGAAAGAPAVELRRVRAQSCLLPSPAAAGVRLSGAGAFRPR